MFEYSEDEGQAKKRRNPFELELKQLLLYYAQLQAQPESLDHLIPRILSSVGKVFTEFASYAQSLDFPHNCMLYPYNPYKLTQSALPAGKTGGNSFALEFVRWRRKPRWLPVAKSKMFRVPERKKQTEEERTELMRLHNQYK